MSPSAPIPTNPEDALERPCPICAGPVPDRPETTDDNGRPLKAPGPPRRFCCTACQRAGRLERDRINRRLGKLEEMHDRLKRGNSWERGRAPYYGEQLADLKARLLELL